tara:strand:- start:563 stop:1108 length:546 start_codon:yes stop_codon:yes gene_type:complete
MSTGFLHIICGPMFSGKTTYLINEINTLKLFKKNILIINSKKDNRVSEDAIKTHNNIKYEAIKYEDLTIDDIQEIINTYDTICIDEAQFFSNLVVFVDTLLKESKHIIVAGLNGDSNQQKFGYIPDLIPLCNKITKLSAVCNICNDGTPGDFTKIKSEINKTNQVLIGDNSIYMAVCRKHL